MLVCHVNLHTKAVAYTVLPRALCAARGGAWGRPPSPGPPPASSGARHLPAPSRIRGQTPRQGSVCCRMTHKVQTWVYMHDARQPVSAGIIGAVSGADGLAHGQVACFASFTSAAASSVRCRHTLPAARRQARHALMHAPCTRTDEHSQAVQQGGGAPVAHNGQVQVLVGRVCDVVLDVQRQADHPPLQLRAHRALVLVLVHEALRAQNGGTWLRCLPSSEKYLGCAGTQA